MRSNDSSMYLSMDCQCCERDHHNRDTEGPPGKCAETLTPLPNLNAPDVASQCPFKLVHAGFMLLKVIGVPSVKMVCCRSNC